MWKASPIYWIKEKNRLSGFEDEVEEFEHFNKDKH